MHIVSNHLNKFQLILIITISTVIGFTSTYFGVFTIGFVLLPFIIFLILKIKLNSNNATKIVSFMVLVNILRPIGGFSVLSLTIDFIVFIIVMKYLLVKGVTKEKSIILFLVTTFIIISFLEIFNPNIPSFMAGLEGFRKTSFAFLLFYVGFLSFKNFEQVKKFLITLSIISIPILIYGIKQHLFFSSFDNLYISANNAGTYTGLLFGKPRATSFFAGPFHLGMFGAIMTVINICLFNITKNLKHKLLFILLAIISVFACYSSLTRTTLLSLLVALLVYFALINVKKTIILTPVFTISFLAFGIWAYYKGQELSQFDNSFLELLGSLITFSDDSRFLGRVDGWYTIINLVKQQPILAYGTGSAGDALGNSYSFQYHVTSHNFFLKILMETGVIGFVIIIFLFLLLIAKMLKNIFTTSGKIKEINLCCFSVFCVFLVNSFSISTIETAPVAGLILLLVGVALSNIVTKEEKLQVEIGK